MPQEQQMTYRSLQIKGTNSSKLTIDYYIFAIYEKNNTIEIISGVIGKVKL